MRKALDALLPVNAQKVFLADVRFVGPHRIIRDIAKAETSLPANLELPPGVFQSCEATPAFPAQKKIDRTMPDGLVIM